MFLEDEYGLKSGTDAYYDDPDNFVSVIVTLPDVDILQKAIAPIGCEIIEATKCKNHSCNNLTSGSSVLCKECQNKAIDLMNSLKKEI